MRTDRFYSTLCTLLTGACVLATVPVLEMGFNDDFSYIFIARGFAATGHLAYNGWAGTMIGVEAWWAALFIRLFGFSFTAVRLSTLPLAMGCSWLLYGLARRGGLNRRYAVFGTLVVTLSPVFIPMAASFMTDVPGFFLWLLCIHCAFRGAESTGRARAAAWILAVAATGVAGGTVRQVIWVAPLMALPAAAWVRREDRALVAACAVLWCAAALAMLVCLRWFQSQPFATPLADMGKFTPSLKLLRDEVESVLQLGVCCLLLMLPVLSIWLADWRRLLRAPLALAAGIALSGACLVALLWVFQDDLLLGNIITPFGVLDQGTEAMGVKPEVLPALVRAVLGLAVFAAAGAAAASWFRRAEPVGTRPAGSLRPVLLFLLPSTAVYTAAVLYRAVNDWILFDRYAIPLLPALAIPLLWHCQWKVRTSPSRMAWTALGLFAVYGVAATHDYFAAGRARVRAADSVTAAGIPRTRVTAGLEYDGWTELEHSGHIANPESPEERSYPVAEPYWFWDHTPSVDPRYFVVYSALPGLRAAPFPAVGYTAWLPPFHRQVLVQMARE